MQRRPESRPHRTPSRGSSPRSPWFRRRAGFSLIYTCIALVAFAVIASLGVDVAHVHLVKTELQCAADAAARAGAQGAANSTWATLASTTAAYNKADGASVVLVTSGTDRDVFVGNWDTSDNTFSPGVTPYNAVRVIARRVASRDNATNLAFARVIGLTQMDISAEAIAYKGPDSYGLIGLDFIKLSGSGSTASYYSNGKPGAGFGSAASNGPIQLNGTSYINGDARPGVGYSVDNPGNVSGSTKSLKTPLSYANGDPSPYGPSNNNNSYVPNWAMNGNSLDLGGSNTLTLPGGNYYVQDFSVATSSTITFTGPATVYVYGFLSLNGTVQTAANTPANLKIVSVPNAGGSPPGAVTISSSATVYASVYAPQSAITMSGGGAIYGSVLGKSISMTGTSDIFYDLALDPDAELTKLVK